MPLFAVPLCLAQFSNLATTASGDRIFFVTPLRQPGLNQFPHQKLFVLAGDGVGLPSLSLVFQSPLNGTPSFHNGFAPANVSASADGRYVAFTTFAACGVGSSCFLRELASGSVLDVVRGDSVFEGLRVRVSRNGRYVLSQPTGGPPSSTPAVVAVLDRTTNETHNIPAGAVIALSSKGDVLLYRNSLELIPWNGPPRTFPIAGAQAMNDRASTIVFTNAYDDPDQARLFAYDIASGRQWQLGPGDRASYNATLSGVGQWVLYLTKLGGTPQLMLSRPDGSGWKQVTAGPSGIREGVLSGDAQVAWAATADGRLLKVTTDHLDTSEVLAPPVFTDTYWNVSPGSLLRLSGYRLGADVRIEGRPVPVRAANGSEVDVQVPWDLPRPNSASGIFDLIISSARDGSPLEAVTPEFSAYWNAVQPSGWSAAIHEDWKSFVSDADPASPGEILHIYAIGLGPTNCDVPLGQPAPLDRLCTPAADIPGLWYWTGANGPDRLYADVLFAGLAPGLVGLYQIDVRVFPYPPAPRLELFGGLSPINAVADVPVRQ